MTLNERQQALTGFLTEHGVVPPDSASALQQQLTASDADEFGLPRIRALYQDASTRRYYRLEVEERSLILMDAPPASENPAAFIQTSGYLDALGARVPELIATDPDQGFLAIEDLGNQTFTRLLADGADEAQLYLAAVSELSTIQANFLAMSDHIDLPPYDFATTLREANLLVEWYLPARLGRVLGQSERDEFASIWRHLFDARAVISPVMVHRDYHVDNLLMVDDRCAMLDYQDALLGSPLYDLVSLLEDARRDVDPDLQLRLIRNWQEAHSSIAEDFNREYQFWGAQRHCKVAGIFTRLWLRDGKAQYLQHLPRVMRLLDRNLQADLLTPLREWLAQLLPAVTHADFTQDAASLRRMMSLDYP